MIYATGPPAAASALVLVGAESGGSPAVASPPVRAARRSAMTTTATTTSFLRRMPESLALHILKFLPLEDLLTKVALLDSYSARMARSTDLWENHLTELYPLPELLEPVQQRAPLAERRSKGKVQIGRMKGTGKLFAIRTVSLETTNAGKDDGIPTSCLRELSVASDVRHPNVLRCLGGWVDGPILTIVSEYCGNSLFSTLNAAHNGLPAAVVKNLMRQLVSGVAALHQRGIIHRNLKSDNIILTDVDSAIANPTANEGTPTLKICDLSTSRLLDQPVGAYTPEDPKERDRSYREQRRLYNRSPEVILRQPLYGGELDIWSIGCLFVELALGEPPFRCESEIGLLLSTVQICGTPPVSLWDRLSSSPQIFVRLPRWDPIDFRAIAQVLCDPKLRAAGVNAAPLLRYHPRQDCLQMLLKFGAKVGAAGLMLLERLLVMPSCFRVTAQEIASFPYFRSDDSQAAAEVTAWVQSYNSPPDSVLMNMSVETRSLIHFQRFIEIERQRYAQLKKGEATRCTADEENLIACIRAMEERSFGVPTNYRLLANIPYDYAEELVKLRAANEKKSISNSASFVEVEGAAMNNLECQLTPAPTNRSAANGRRQRQDTEQVAANSRHCDSTAATRTPGAGDSTNSHRRHNAQPSETLQLYSNQLGTITSPSNSGFISNASPHTDGTCCSLWETDWQTQLDFELDHECHIPHRAIAAPSIRPTLTASSCEGSTQTSSVPVSQCDALTAAASSSEAADGHLGVSGRISLLTQEQRKLVALCQSPLNSVKASGLCPTTPGDSLRSVFRRKTRLSRLQAALSSGESAPEPPAQGSQWIGQRSHNVAWAKLPQPLPWLRPRVSPRARLEIVNFMQGIQPEFLLRSQTLHLAVSLFDRYSCHLLGQPDGFTSCDFVPLALTCLKIADIYNEISKEYYKQDNIVEYCEYSLAPGVHMDEMVDEKGRLLRSVTVTPSELLAEEKKVLNLLAFRVMHPTTCWLVDAYLCKAKLLQLPELVDYCHYLADLGLYCHRLLAFRPALQAQCILLIASCTLYRPRCEGVVLKHTNPKYCKALTQFLQHFCRHRDVLCAANNLWEVLDCLAVFESLLTDGKRLFEAMALRSVERLHSWVGRTAVTVATGISPSCVRCILPSSQEFVLASLEEGLFV